MKEYDYFCGTVSFFKPDIQINEVKTFEKKSNKIQKKVK
jgi:hypothetical protein